LKMHHWKRLFFLLIGVNIAFVFLVILVFVILIKSPIEDAKVPDTQTVQSGVQFNVKTNKQDLNLLINHYIKKEYSGSLDYEVLLTDEVELNGKIPVFSENVEMKLTFEPIALENGDLVLQQKNILIGKLTLPVPLVLNFIQNSYSLPDWVTIQPYEEKVYMKLQNMKLKSDLKVKVTEFDLKNDDIEFSLRVPLE
jgi:uncharacterized protein YpmS